MRTEIRLYDGDVESLTVAESRGVGVRVIRDGREGLAHAGSWDSDVIDTLLAEARDNMSFAEPDDRVGLAEPDGVGAADDPWDDRIEATSVDDKVAIAVALEAATRGADPRVRGVRTSMYADSRGESAIVSTAGIDGWDAGHRHRSAHSRSSTIPTAPLAPAMQATLRRRPVARHRGGRPTRSGARCSSSGRRTPTTGRPLVVLEPRFTATILGIVAGMLSGELVVKGRTPLR